MMTDLFSEVALMVVSSIVGLVIGGLVVAVKMLPRITRIEDSIIELKADLNKADLSAFENRFLERLNGRYFRNDLAELLKSKADERYRTINYRLERLEKNAPI